MDSLLDYFSKTFGDAKQGPQWSNIIGTAAVAAVGGLISIFSGGSVLAIVGALLIGALAGVGLMGNSAVSDFVKQTTSKIHNMFLGAPNQDQIDIKTSKEEADKRKLYGITGVIAADTAIVSAKLAPTVVKAGYNAVTTAGGGIIPETLKTTVQTIVNNVREAVHFVKPAKVVASATETTAATVKTAAAVAQETGFLTKTVAVLKGAARFFGVAGAGITVVADAPHAVTLFRKGETGSGVVQTTGTLAEAGGMLLGPVGMAAGTGIKDALYIGDTLAGGRTINGIYFPGGENITKSGLATLIQSTPVVRDVGDALVGAPTRYLADKYYDYKFSELHKQQIADSEQKAQRYVGQFSEKDQLKLKEMVATAHAKGEKDYTTLQAVFDLTDQKIAGLSKENREKVDALMKGDNHHTQVTAVRAVEEGFNKSPGTTPSVASADSPDKNKRS